jgi:restriction system protein
VAPAWKQYQEKAAEFFRSLGLKASTDVTLHGIRTAHDIDVFVSVDVAGFEARWLVECKHWKSPVSKLHVLALREIVADLGADRGILLCEVGFQSGAVEAANLTNVQITSLSALAISSKDAIYAVRLRDLYDRTEACRERYWDIPKDVRIDKGLRFDTGDGKNMYSGARVVDICSEILTKAFRGNYPISVDLFARLSNPRIPESLDDHQEVVTALEPLIADLEAKLNTV